jgi:hypothetical protein
VHGHLLRHLIDLSRDSHFPFFFVEIVINYWTNMHSCTNSILNATRVAYLSFKYNAINLYCMFLNLLIFCDLWTARAFHIGYYRTCNFVFYGIWCEILIFDWQYKTVARFSSYLVQAMGQRPISRWITTPPRDFYSSQKINDRQSLVPKEIFLVYTHRCVLYKRRYRTKWDKCNCI